MPGSGSAASTLALADDLARLMDDMVIRKVEWSALDGLVLQPWAGAIARSV